MSKRQKPPDPETSFKAAVRKMIGPQGEEALKTIVRVARGETYVPTTRVNGQEMEGAPEVPKLAQQLQAAMFLVTVLHGRPGDIEDDGGGKHPSDMTDDELKIQAARITKKHAKKEDDDDDSDPDT